MRSLIIWLALVIDQLIGDPPNRFHPVAWIGQVVNRVEPRLPKRDASSAFIAGLVSWLTGSSLVIGLAWVGKQICQQLAPPFNWLGEGFLLKLTLSQSGLVNAAVQVESALGEDLDQARQLVSWHLVSRDTSHLSVPQVTAATIESIAENTSDGIIAPLFYFALGGLPFAWFYRFANTLDSMWGYHDPNHEWLGKTAARLDDLLNFIPARLTTICIILSAWMTGKNSHQALSSVLQDAHNPSSPNAGFPMSAMAGALEIELEKVETYQLGKGLRKPEATEIEQAIKIMSVATLLGSAILSGYCMFAMKPTRK